MHKNILLVIIFSAVRLTALAQYAEVMRAIRPGQAIGPWTAGKNILQMHTGLDIGWSESNDEATDIYYRFHAHNAVICYGLAHKFELNALPEFRVDHFDANNIESKTYGLSLAAIGGRYNIYDGGSLYPSVGVQGLFKLPILSQAYKTNYVAPRLLTMISYSPSGAISILCNLGFEYDGISNSPIELYAINFAFALTDRFGAFIETYGSYRRTPVYNHVDLGLYYYITNHLQIDAFGGMGSHTNQYEAFFSTGVSYRVNTGHHHKT